MSERTKPTLQRELRRVVAEKAEARRDGDRERLDWLYGAEVALSWALGEDTMAPSRAFTIYRVHA